VEWLQREDQKCLGVGLNNHILVTLVPSYWSPVLAEYTPSRFKIKTSVEELSIKMLQIKQVADVYIFFAKAKRIELKQGIRQRHANSSTHYLDKATPSYKFLLKLTKTRTEFQNLLPTNTLRNSNCFT
jgi:hypothetical protein